MTILLAEKAPPGKKAEEWIKANKSRFKDKYGDKAGEKILYGKAWNLFGEEKEINEGYTVKKTHIEKASKDDEYGSDADVHHYDVIHNKSGKKVGTVQQGLFGTTLKTSKTSYDLGGRGDVQAMVNKSSKAKKILGEEEINEVSHKTLKSAETNAYLDYKKREHKASEMSPLKGDSQKDQSAAWEKANKRKRQHEKFKKAREAKEPVTEDVAANAMGDSASNPDAGNIKGFSPKLFKSPKLLKRHERLLRRILQNLPKK